MSEADDEAQIRRVDRVEWIGDRAQTGADWVAREEPLEIRLGQLPLAVVMRTPGHDEELAWGFCLTERIVADAAAIAWVRHCSDVDVDEAEDNVIQIALREGTEVDVGRLRRNLYASSSCGICGKATIDNVLVELPPIVDDLRVDLAVVRTLPATLRARQHAFDRTGGLHAAGLFDGAGEALVVREDVGRHNAVDKVIGAALRGGRRSLAGTMLAVSGRISYEIAQKAVAARIPVVVAVSAPSSLAIELAARAQLTLVGFTRGDRLCVYAGAERLR
jgi:FdhD protein